MSPFRAYPDWSGFRDRATPADRGEETSSPDEHAMLELTQPPVHWWQRLSHRRLGAAFVPGVVAAPSRDA
jgi:hypothetical protein